MKTARVGARLWLAAVSALALTAYASAQTPTATPVKAPAPAKSDAKTDAKPAAAKAKASDDEAWPKAAVADPAKLGFTKAGLDALDARLKQSVADGDTAGMTWLLIRHGQVADFKAAGQQNPDKAMALDSLFRIYSMSKPITGVAMMQLYEQGKWKLDDPITKFAPELAGLKELTWDKDGKVVMGADGKPVLATPKRPATMKELMSHTAGFGYGLGGDDPGQRRLPQERRAGVQRPQRDDGQDQGHPPALRTGHEMVLLRRRRYPGLYCPEALGPKVRRLSQGQRHRSDGHERHAVLRLGRPEAALHRGLSLGQGRQEAGDEPQPSGPPGLL